MESEERTGVDRPRPASMTLPPVMREFCLTVLGLSLFSAAYCLLMRYGLHRAYPYDWPLFKPGDRFGDFTIYIHKFTLFHTMAFFSTGFPFTYPAPTAIAFEAFFKIGGHHPLRTFLVFAVVAFLLPAALFGRALYVRGLNAKSASLFTLMLVVTSWPALLLIDRANIEIVVWAVLVIGVWAYARGREWSAAVCFGLAASLKLFPFVYLALFLTRRKFPKVLVGAAVFFVSSVVAFAVLGPSIPVAYHGISAGLSYFHDSYMRRYLLDEGGLDHSLLAFLKVLVHHTFKMDRQGALNIATRIYLPLTAVLGAVLYFWRIRKMPPLNQLLLLTIASIYFTPFSGDGTLIHLYYAFALFCFLAMDGWRKGMQTVGLRAVFLCFSFLFATVSFLLVRGQRFEGQGKCVVLGVLFVCALRYGFGPPEIEVLAGEGVRTRVPA